jgi:peptidoglycan/xylan/chitin deacetylase (PgdA/CDA1 family)
MDGLEVAHAAERVYIFHNHLFPMPRSLLPLIPAGLIGTSLAALIVISGVSRVIRHWRRDQAVVLTFHSVYDGSAEPDSLLDRAAHIELALFRQVCRHLASRYDVVPLESVCRQPASIRSGKRKVALTFDDGYASNLHLALPVLQEHALPATVFLTTGFVDGDSLPWFIRAEHAFLHTTRTRLAFNGRDHDLRLPAQRTTAYREFCAYYKSLPTATALKQLGALESQLGVAAGSAADLPAALRPMTWEQARQMRDSTYVTLGGHTHTHPILAQCTARQQAHEIRECRARMLSELGAEPTLFAYPNGKLGDYDQRTKALLQAAGFHKSFTMAERSATAQDDPLAIPRHGSPQSTRFLEATASGGVDWLRALKLQVTHLFQRRPAQPA